ncbi:hypothetical protein RM844_02510 [Streptomyces sp. DSM 44915]|uniref:Uncharacterized protein n=1 Tax=Streptomyces chisholmiae TaxID=3075540 RepID=A0ABU2JJI9_9ACTN|nr:hypothetical protein [Streptomyces sp. DSM 44915]MDT0265156.1 hypothetical protein [Streptomyces sp. DSM 44915]
MCHEDDWGGWDDWDTGDGAAGDAGEPLAIPDRAAALALLGRYRPALRRTAAHP